MPCQPKSFRRSSSHHYGAAAHCTFFGPSRPPGSSRRAGGYSPVFRLGSLTRLPGREPCSKKQILLDMGTSKPALATKRRTHGETPPARLLHAGGSTLDRPEGSGPLQSRSFWESSPPMGPSESPKSKVPAWRGHTGEELRLRLHPNWPLFHFSSIDCYQ